MAAVDSSRRAVLEVPTAAAAVLTTYDDADAAAARGDRTAAAASRATADSARPTADQALADLDARLAEHRAALAELDAAAQATTSLDSGQRTALATVAAGGTNEAAAVEATGAALRTAWPAYDGLGVALDTWLERARAGWYRSPEESAGGYAVLAAPGRGALEQARGSLVDAERRRTVEVDAQSARLAQADAALASLRTPG